jgi:hypothetical protein
MLDERQQSDCGDEQSGNAPDAAARSYRREQADAREGKRQGRDVLHLREARSEPRQHRTAALPADEDDQPQRHGSRASGGLDQRGEAFADAHPDHGRGFSAAACHIAFT